MINKRYGAVFRQLREQKELPLSFFEKVGISKSSISKFERGEVMMAYDKIYCLLDAIDVSVAEYDLLINNFYSPFQELFFIEMEKAEFSQNKKRLQKLFEEVDGSSPTLMNLIVKSKISSLSNEEVHKILEYLGRTSFWTYFELSLLQATIEGNNIEASKQFFSKIEKNIFKFQGVFKYQRKISLIVLHYILNLALHGEKEFSLEMYSKIIKVEYSEFDFFICCLKGLVKGFIKYRFDDKKEGYKECMVALEQLEDLGSKELRCYYEKLTNITLSNNLN